MAAHGLLCIQPTGAPSTGPLRTFQIKSPYFLTSMLGFIHSIQLSVCRCCSHQLSFHLSKRCRPLRRLLHQYQLSSVVFSRMESFQLLLSLTLQTVQGWWHQDILHTIDNWRFKNCYNWTSHSHLYQQVVQQQPDLSSIHLHYYVSRAIHLALGIFYQDSFMCGWSYDLKKQFERLNNPSHRLKLR